MDKIINKWVEVYNKIKKNGVPGLVWVLSACLVVVVAALIFMPEAKAESPTATEWTPNADTGYYELGDIDTTSGSVSAEITVNAGGTYIISGTGTTKDNPLSGVFIKFKYDGSNDTDGNAGRVNIILKNVNMTRNYDEPLISFTTVSNSVDYHLTIEGECNLTSNITSDTSVTPVMSVEDIEYSLLKIVQPQLETGNETVVDYYTAEDTIRRVSLYIGGRTTESTFNITVSDTSSYGAVIGASEAGTLKNRLKVTSDECIALLNALLEESYGDDKIYVGDPAIVEELVKFGFIPTTGNKAEFIPQYVFGGAKVCGAGKIIIGESDGSAPLRLNIVNSGHGAALGGGGVLTTTGDTTTGDTTTSTSKSTIEAQRITINAGTVYITSLNDDTVVVGTGSIIDTSTMATGVAGIEINGGSILISSDGEYFAKQPVNSLGESVYLIKADTTNNADGKKIQNLANLTVGDEIPVEYLYDEVSGLQFTEDLDKLTDAVVAEETISENTSPS